VEDAAEPEHLLRSGRLRRPAVLTRRTAASEPLIGPDGFQQLPPELMMEAEQLLPAEARPPRPGRGARGRPRRQQEPSEGIAFVDDDAEAGPSSAAEPERGATGRAARAAARQDRQRRGRKRPRERAAAAPRRQGKRARRTVGDHDFVDDEDGDFLVASDEDEPDSDADSEAVWSEGSELDDPVGEDAEDDDDEGLDDDPVRHPSICTQTISAGLLGFRKHDNPSLASVGIIKPTGGNRGKFVGLQKPQMPRSKVGARIWHAAASGMSSYVVVVQEAETRRAATAARRAENRQRRRAATAAVQEVAGFSQGEGGAPRRLGAAKAREPTMYEWLQVGAAAERAQSLYTRERTPLAHA